MVSNFRQIEVSNADRRVQEALLRPMPYEPSQFALWTIAAMVAAPLGMAAGFVATGQPADGAFALPFIAFGVHKLLRECWSA